MILGQASLETRARGSREITPDDLMLGLLSDVACPGCRTLRSAGVDLGSLEQALRQPSAAHSAKAPLRWSEHGALVLKRLRKVASSGGSEDDTDHLLRAILQVGHGAAAKYLLDQGVTDERIGELSLYGPLEGAGQFVWRKKWSGIENSADGMLPSLLTLVRLPWGRPDLLSLLLIEECGDRVTPFLVSKDVGGEDLRCRLEDRWLAALEPSRGLTYDLFCDSFDPSELLRRVSEDEKTDTFKALAEQSKSAGEEAV